MLMIAISARSATSNVQSSPPANGAKPSTSTARTVEILAVGALGQVGGDEDGRGREGLGHWPA